MPPNRSVVTCCKGLGSDWCKQQICLAMMIVRSRCCLRCTRCSLQDSIQEAGRPSPPGLTSSRIHTAAEQAFQVQGCQMNICGQWLCPGATSRLASATAFPAWPCAGQVHKAGLGGMRMCFDAVKACLVEDDGMPQGLKNLPAESVLNQTCHLQSAKRPPFACSICIIVPT